jgi:hypothetical protein
MEKQKYYIHCQTMRAFLLKARKEDTEGYWIPKASCMSLEYTKSGNIKAIINDEFFDDENRTILK